MIIANGYVMDRFVDHHFEQLLNILKVMNIRHKRPGQVLDFRSSMLNGMIDIFINR